MAAFFYGLPVQDWCTGVNSASGLPNINFLNNELKYPGNLGTEESNWATITNSFANQKDDFAYKLFTIGGGSMSNPWSKSDIQMLGSGCSNGQGLIDLIKAAGYNGVMLDYEYEQDADAANELKSFIENFSSAYPGMTLSFTTLGNPNAGGATTSLVNTLKATSDHWSFVVPQLYDASACNYADVYMEQAKAAFEELPSSKVLLGLADGTTANPGIGNSGSVDWLVRPQPYTN